MTYTYKCCNQEYIVESSINQEHDKSCPICGKEGKRIFKPTANIWKCNGNYNATR